SETGSPQGRGPHRTLPGRKLAGMETEATGTTMHPPLPPPCSCVSTRCAIRFPQLPSSTRRQSIILETDLCISWSAAPTDSLSPLRPDPATGSRMISSKPRRLARGSIVKVPCSGILHGRCEKARDTYLSEAQVLLNSPGVGLHP